MLNTRCRCMVSDELCAAVDKQLAPLLSPHVPADCPWWSRSGGTEGHWYSAGSWRGDRILLPSPWGSRGGGGVREVSGLSVSPSTSTSTSACSSCFYFNALTTSCTWRPRGEPGFFHPRVHVAHLHDFITIIQTCTGGGEKMQNSFHTYIQAHMLHLNAKQLLS